MKFAFAAVLAATLLATIAFAQTPKLATEETMVKSPDPGIEIYVRNKHPSGMTSFRSERSLLFVHGATYPASTTFDLPLDGESWMDYIAARGFDCMSSTSAATASQAGRRRCPRTGAGHPPIVRGDTAIKDIGAIIDFILSRRNIPRLNLMGWSWGTVTMATYTTQNPQKVERLALYAPAGFADALAHCAASRRRPARRL